MPIDFLKSKISGMSNAETEKQYEQVLAILESERQRVLSRPDQKDPSIYNRHVKVDFQFGDTKVVFEMQDLDLQAIIIPTINGDRMYVQRVKPTTKFRENELVEYVQTTIVERHIQPYFPEDMGYQVGELIKRYGNLVVPTAIDAIDQAIAIS